MTFKIIQESGFNKLTKFPIASFKELATISSPLVILTLSLSMLGLCDRYFLSQYSMESWKACSAAINLCYFYQIILVVIGITSQACIARLCGENKESSIGPLVWQMIYFSIISMIITYPLSRISEFYLRGSEIQDLSIIYFRYLSLANFLFPLGATLSSFYVGRGKTLLILILNILVHVTNIGIDYLLIFGVKGWFKPMGIRGAAIGTICSQGLLCIILFLMFLQKKHVSLYCTNQRKFNYTLLTKVLKIGFPRALGRCLVVGSWVMASYLLINHGGDYLLVHTFGVTIFLIFSSINEGMSQGLITIVSYLLGSNTIGYYKKLFNAILIYMSITTIILSIPLLLMQRYTIAFFIQHSLPSQTYELLKECCIWIWLVCIGSAITRVGASLLTASHDTTFYACFSLVNFITLCIPVYLGIGYFGWTPPKFFLIDALNCSFLGSIFIYRFIKKSCHKKEILSPSSL